MQQLSQRIFMIRPAHFGFNEQTAASNTFQQLTENADNAQSLALQEFDAAVAKLQSAGIEVLVIDDDAKKICPDAIFPNNWMSTHEEGTVVLYPMQSPNRREERREDVIRLLEKKYSVSRLIDLSHYEAQGAFLEGTGSIVFDHHARIAYACLSPRTQQHILEELCVQINYKAHCFSAEDENGVAVYHTNVVMGIGNKYAVISLASISSEIERKNLIVSLKNSGKEIIDISLAQVKSFAGNVLAIKNDKGNEILALSLSAFKVLSIEQKATLERFCTLLPISIPTIETVGGGSVRCMIAQNFLDML